MPEEREEQVVFGAGKVDGGAVGRGQLAARGVERPSREGQAARARIWLRAGGSGAAQQGAHARDELARRKGLRDVVVGAQLETEHAVQLLAARREHEDGDARALAQPAQEVQARGARQHHVEQDQVGRAGGTLEHVPHLAAVPRGGHEHRRIAQQPRDEAAHLAVVLDDEDMRLRVEQAALGALGHRAASTGA